MAVKNVGICRARDQDQKLARRQDLMDAGWALFQEQEDQLPSVAQVAKKAGLAKGTFYLYFKTKEELFIELFKDAFESFFINLNRALVTTDVDLEALIDNFVKYICHDDVLIKLGALFNGVLEQNTDESIVVRFKLRMVQLLLETGQMIATLVRTKNQETPCFKAISAGDAARLLVRSYAVFLGVVQMLPPKNLSDNLDGLPELEPIKLDLEFDTTVILRALWIDALVDPQCGSATA